MEHKSTRNQKGWLVKYLIALDHLFFKRWQYWTKICQNNQLDDEPIPVIRFQSAHSYPQRQVSKNIRKCLEYASSLSHPLEAFIDWILWGFNYGEQFPRISEKEDDFWYRTFNLGLFYLEPADHFGEFASEYLGGHNSIGYFATPGEVVDLMVRMTFGGEPQPEHRTMSVCEPCCGTGVMLLYASNYSLNLYGVDISGLLTKIAIVNGYIYVPWLVFRPKYLTIFDREARQCVESRGAGAVDTTHPGRRESEKAIKEINLPNGIKVPECQNCHGRTFLNDLETQHEIEVIKGTVKVHKPHLEQDLIAKHLKPENITCAECFRKFDREQL